MEIVSAFQRSLRSDNSEEIAAIPLSELKSANALLGNRDVGAGFRIALDDRISKSRNGCCGEERASSQNIEPYRWLSRYCRWWFNGANFVAGGELKKTARLPSQLVPNVAKFRPTPLPFQDFPYKTHES